MFEKMTEEAEKDGYIIKASSGYRSYTYQKSLLENAIENGNKNADKSIAKAGYSEHQLGTAIDLTGKSINFSTADSSFGNTEESVWLDNNSYKYGFILSYPKDKEYITGYIYEPWHYRYVGIKNAKKIKNSKLTITEFLK